MRKIFVLQFLAVTALLSAAYIGQTNSARGAASEAKVTEESAQSFECRFSANDYTQNIFKQAALQDVNGQKVGSLSAKHGKLIINVQSKGLSFSGSVNDFKGRKIIDLKSEHGELIESIWAQDESLLIQCQILDTPAVKSYDYEN